MTAKNAITELLARPLGLDWTVEGLAEQVLDAVATGSSSDGEEFILDSETTTDRQTQRLLRPLLACLANKWAAETGKAPHLFGGHFCFQRLGSPGPVWIVGQYENRPERVRITLRRSSTPPETASARPGQPTAITETPRQIA